VKTITYISEINKNKYLKQVIKIKQKKTILKEKVLVK